MTVVLAPGVPVRRRCSTSAHAAARRPLRERLPRLRRTAAGLRLVVAWGVLGLIAGLLLAVTGGELVRVQAMTVLSGSMRPTLGVGDLVLTQVTRADEVQAGDVVTFRDPSVQRYVTHRVQSVVWRGQTADVITRGDANEVGEAWSVRAEGTLGVVVLRVPWLGYVVGALSTRTGHLAMTAAAVLLGGWSLLLIWRPGRENPSGPAPPEEPTPPGDVADVPELVGASHAR